MSNEDFDLSLLDKNLSDIEDIPGFEVPPAGNYQLLLGAITKKVNEHPAVTIDCEVIETLQLANEAEKPAIAGTKFGLLFMLDNEFGIGNLKKFLTPFAEHFSTESLRELVTEKVQNVVVTATIKQRVDKNDKEKIYAELKNIAIV